MEKPKDVQEYDGYYMPDLNKVKKLPEDELEKLIEETAAKHKKIAADRLNK